VVISRDGQPLTLAEITTFLEGHQLARHKFPERLELVPEFPMTPSGKIQKYRLRQLVAERITASESPPHPSPPPPNPSPPKGERAG
jgi:non-ribosomal peptide synthetase component E (peptide arylation enzyme)